MAPHPLPIEVLRRRGSRKLLRKSDADEDAPPDLIKLADEADLATLRTAQKLLREAMRDVEQNGLFVTSPRGIRQRNPAAILIGQQQRIISALTRGMRAPRRPRMAEAGAMASSGKLINGIPIESQLGKYLLKKPDPIDDGEPHR